MIFVYEVICTVIFYNYIRNFFFLSYIYFAFNYKENTFLFKEVLIIIKQLSVGLFPL